MIMVAASLAASLLPYRHFFFLYLRCERLTAPFVFVADV
jgi:hypothetical protein